MAGKKLKNDDLFGLTKKKERRGGRCGSAS
jgi:hypothetical protein